MKYIIPSCITVYVVVGSVLICDYMHIVHRIASYLPVSLCILGVSVWLSGAICLPMMWAMCCSEER